MMALLLSIVAVTTLTESRSLHGCSQVEIANTKLIFNYVNNLIPRQVVGGDGRKDSGGRTPTMASRRACFNVPQSILLFSIDSRYLDLQNDNHLK